MAEENNQDQNNSNTGTNDTDQSKKTDDQSKNVDIQKLVEEQVAAQLKDIKGKLDNSYKARDEALAKVAEFERAQKEAELKRLQEEGKHKEAAEIQVAEERAKREAAEKRITELTRDVSVREALNGLSFRNDRAADIAFKEVVGQLIQDANGQWIHKSGVAIKEFVAKFAADEEQSFLFKPKANSGGGTSESKGSSGSSGKKSLFEMSQAEVLKLAAEGKLK